ncbi:hypothetical protein QBC34DRAFT_460849 [Podospora aff. communis PSN243]|uniref:Uncharacterized protein n=1 Tax=Podospora aff. communis PSN243 TaxID=3040156 RepID=A0AAV9GV54_9PEZI|nr:hypothetical protein QBC34DRAFT_460849 [Podospora aff. communis PSN243]
MANADTHQSAFLSIPGELRNKIYRILFIYSKPTSSGRRRGNIRHSGQLIRTCKQVYNESLSILYGERTFGVTISNIHGPHVGGLLIDKVLDDVMFNTRHCKEFRQKHRQAVLPHIRRLHIDIEYTYAHRLRTIRHDVRNIVHRLQQDDIRPLDFLELNCKLDYEDQCNANYRTEEWDSYITDIDGDETECCAMLRTWFGSLRNVKEVVINGLPDKDAEILRRRLQTRTKDEEGSVLPEAPEMALAAMYAALEKHAEGIPACAEDLEKALSAAEGDQVEDFRTRKNAIQESLKKHWEAINSDKKLWKF